MSNIPFDGFSLIIREEIGESWRGASSVDDF